MLSLYCVNEGNASKHFNSTALQGVGNTRIMLFSCNLLNYMLFWFYLLGLICFSQCMLYVLATHNVLGTISLFMIIDLCTFCKALPCKSLWIKRLLNE